MYPSVELFGREIPTYGLMAAAGIICGLLFVFIYARKLKLDAENAAYIYTFGFIGAGIGAKILYLIISAGQIIEHMKTVGFMEGALHYIQGGLVYYGGLFGAIGAAFLTARYLKVDIRDYYPALVPGIAILAGFGRIGCFLAGCCYGAETHSSFSVIYPEGSGAPCCVPLVPIQLYEAMFEFVIIAVLVLLYENKPSVKPHLLKIYCCTYAIVRFILEFWRGDDVRGLWGAYSTSQWISLLLITFIAVKEVLNTRRKEEK
jgi:phosphatidylglycerol:prolipoprotein diacylglycerol transferase